MSSPFNPPVCDFCNDLRVIAIDSSYRETRPCPKCGDELARSTLVHARLHDTLPKIQMRDLTADERAQVEEWEKQGHNVLNCLRWIEGQRWKPDEEYRSQAKVEYRAHLERIVKLRPKWIDDHLTGRTLRALSKSEEWIIKQVQKLDFLKGEGKP